MDQLSRNYPYDLLFSEGCIDQQKNTMELEGEGIVSTVPDQASIIIGVETVNQSLEQAQRENAYRSNNVIDALITADIDEKDIKTVAYLISKRYEYRNTEQLDMGYSVINKFEVIIDQIDKVGYIVDLAVSDQANIIENIQFNLKDPTSYYLDALNLAVLDAKDKALSLESLLKVKLQPVPIKIVEISSSPMMPMLQFDSRAQAESTPIQTGMLDVAARVKALFKYEE